MHSLTFTETTNAELQNPDRELDSVSGRNRLIAAEDATDVVDCTMSKRAAVSPCLTIDGRCARGVHDYGRRHT